MAARHQIVMKDYWQWRIFTDRDYPTGLKGNVFLPKASIRSVADAVEALSFHCHSLHKNGFHGGLAAKTVDTCLALPRNELELLDDRNKGYGAFAP